MDTVIGAGVGGISAGFAFTVLAPSGPNLYLGDVKRSAEGMADYYEGYTARTKTLINLTQAQTAAPRFSLTPTPGGTELDRFTGSPIAGIGAVGNALAIIDGAKANYNSTMMNIGYKEGWNLFSFGVNKCFYIGTPPTNQPAWVEMVNIADLGFDSISKWFSSLLDSENAWEIVFGSDGAMQSDLPDIFNTLKYMSVCSGYHVKIKEGTGGATLSLTGQAFDTNNSIPLFKGWNLVSYPMNVGYYDTDSPPDWPGAITWIKVEPTVAAHVFRLIEGSYNIILTDTGSYDPKLPEANSLHYIAPGQGLWINVKNNLNLKYSY